MEDKRVNPSIDNYFIGSQYKCQEKCTVEGFWNEERVGTEPIFQMAALEWTQKTIDLGKIESVLDIGCGPSQKIATLVEAYPMLKITGLDSEETMPLARKYNPSGKYIACDLDSAQSVAKLSKTLELFDLIICLDVIEHILRPENIFTLIHQTASVETELIISTPERDLCRGKDNVLEGSPKPDHIREWNTKEFKELLLYSQFKILDSDVLPQPTDGQFLQVHHCRINR